MITDLQFSGVKGSSFSGKLGPVTVVTGNNWTGKSALVEAIRMALTGACSVGATPAKQSLIVAGAASVLATGSGIRAEWSMAGGKRKHSCTLNGMAADVCGSLPVTTQEWWGLTGDGRWSLLESVVGKFNSNPPASAASIPQLEQRLKSLRATQDPEPYTGTPIDVLRTELSAIQQWLSSQEIARRDGERIRKAKESAIAALSGKRTALAVAEESLATAKKDLGSLALHRSRFEAAIFSWSMSDTSVLDGMGATVSEVIASTIAQVEDKLKAVANLVNSSTLNELTSRLILALEAAKEAAGDLPIPQPEGVGVITEIFSALGLAMKSSPEGCEREYERAIAETNHMLAVAEAATESLKLSLRSMSESASESIPEYDGAKVIEQTLRAQELQQEITKATAYESWINNSAKRASDIAKAEADLASAKDDLAAFNRVRSEYLDKAKASLETAANRILLSMGVKPISIEIGMAGKRSTLTISNGIVDVEAMSGAEKTIYGTALLSAIHEASSVACPLLVVEGGELDTSNLTKLLCALSEVRTKGNTIVEHWYPGCGPKDITRIHFGPEYVQALHGE